MSRLKLFQKLSFPFLHPFQAIKRILPQSLFGRSLIILVTPLILVQVVLGYIFFDRHTETILKLLSDTIAGDITLVVDCIERGDNFKHVKELAKRDLNLDLSLEPKKSLEKTGLHKQTWLYSFLETALNQKLKGPYFVKMDSDYIYIALKTKKGRLNVTLSRKRLFSRTTPLVIIWTTGSSLLLFIVASLFMRNQIRPIRRLAEAADKFGRGGESVHFKPEGATEVRKAGLAFLLMRERLKRQLYERLEMLAGVSHDLRTPLTRMRLQLAMIESNEELMALKQDVIVMQQMVEGFLTYARGAGEEETKKTNLFEMLNKIQNQLCSENFLIHLDCPKDINISLKEGLFNRCLTNLLLNSKRYAKEVEISVHGMERHLQISIDDDGPGIPIAEREKVFRPFYRLDSARNLDIGGVGLGLSIARDAVLSHGGQIYLRHSSVLGGLRVLIRLPLSAV
ncbi:MAG: HAMP domain-containing protein [Alphaproteobacteria bacterium]|nr:HAMP domain-containing protein [Alphaproteobacteria bacterium]